MTSYVFWPATILGVVALVGSFFPMGNYDSHDYSYSRSSYRDSGSPLAASLASGIVTFGLVALFNWLVLHYHMVPTINPSMWLWYFFDLMIALVVTLVCGYAAVDAFTWGSMAVIVLLLANVVGGVFKLNTDITSTEEAKAFLKAHVNVQPATNLPDTSTDHMIAVPEEVADAKAATDLGQDWAGKHSVNTYYNPLPVTPLLYQGHFWGLVTYTYDGARLKHKMGTKIPGYQLVDLENKKADVTQRFDKDPQTGADYWYKYTIDGGQDEDVVRHVYQNGYSAYGLEGVTPEIDEAGHLFFTITLTKPAAGWGYEVPVGLLTVDAASGQIKRYDLAHIPSWIDRVYSAEMVTELLNYWGNWQGADFCRINCNGGGRFKVDGSPVFAYDKSGDPTWRVLMTSQNDNPSANWIMLVSARTGVIKQFTPQGSMPIESRIKGFFESAMGTNGVKIPFAPVDLTFHVIFGQPTWMMTYLSADGKSVAGYGFMQAYMSSPGDVAFDTTKDGALDAYDAKLAAPSSSGAPQQGGKVVSVSGVIVDIQRWDEGGQAYAYIKLDTKPGYKLKVVLNSKNSDVGFARSKDTVVVTYNDNGPDKLVVEVSSITVTPHQEASSAAQALFVNREPAALLVAGAAFMLIIALSLFGWRRYRSHGRNTDDGVPGGSSHPAADDELVEAREHLEELTGHDINGDRVVGHATAGDAGTR